jgi:hypothetical protein
MVRVNEEGSNAINIDYFKLDFNRYRWMALSRPGLTFGAILFIMINRSRHPTLFWGRERVRR